MTHHAGYLALLREMERLHKKKAADYGAVGDPLANIRASAAIGVPPDKGAWLRAKDKVHRIDQHYLRGSLSNESVEDSLLDLASYCLIGLALRREEQGVPDVGRRRARVYIAGPISRGDIHVNVQQALDCHLALVRAGYAAFCPHFTCYSAGPAHAPVAEACPAGTTHADWLDSDLPWVAVSDAVIRLPGESDGADREVACARRLGIPVVESLSDLYRLLPPQMECPDFPRDQSP